MIGFFQIFFWSNTQNSNLIELFFFLFFPFPIFFFIFPDERYKEMSLIVDISVVTSLCVYSFSTCRYGVYRPMYVQANILFLFTMCNMYVIM